MSNFGFDNTTQSEENPQGGTQYIPAGIHDNVFLKDVGYLEPQGNGGEALQISLEDSEGRVLEHRYYDPTKNPYASDQEEINKGIQKFNAICKNLATKILGEEKGSQFPAVESFRDFCEKFAQMVKQNPNYDKIPLRVKVTLNKKNYSMLPGYPPVFDLSQNPYEESPLKINQFDKVERDEPDTEQTAQAGGEEAAASENDPF